jgi:hypothetical protein
MLLALPLLNVAASAQIAVSANDNKAVLVNGVATVADNPASDTVTIIDLAAKPPKVIAELKAPTSVVGPPQSVAVSRDESIALVTGAIKLDPADPKKTTGNNQVTAPSSRPYGLFGATATLPVGPMAVICRITSPSLAHA